MDLGLNVTKRDGFAVMSLHGEVDLATAPSFRERLIELVNDGERNVVVDLDRVDFLDSTGLGVLVGGLKRLRSNGGELSIACSNPRILRVFEVTGLTQVFALHDTVDSAVTTVTSAPGADVNVIGAAGPVGAHS